MSLEDEIFEQRRAKVAALAATGVDPYPRRFAFSHTLAEILARYDPLDAATLERDRVAVQVAGRLAAIRGHGKAAFGHLAQEQARLQIYARQDALGEVAFELWRSLDLGDLVGVRGYLFRTRTGELSVHLEGLELLAKALRPLPEKWHGLQEVEARYRQRYLDLLANPAVREVFQRRGRLIESLRRQFQKRGYLEVETPMMQPLAGGAAARPFVTHHGALDLDLYLRIAPELYLKRLVVGGLERVFEINRNFRNEGISTRHNPEFTMLEFYEAYSDYRVLMDWSEELLRETAREVTGAGSVRFGEHSLDFSALRRLDLRQAVVAYWPPGAGPAPLPDEVRDPRREAEIVARFNRFAAADPDFAPLAWRPPDGVGAGLYALFEAVAERHLIQPTVIFDFPRSVSPLAKSKADEPDWVERFEIFAGGMELANGYSELNDPAEQRRRFERQMAARAAGDAEAHAMDDDYIRALEYGMPPTAGEGIGIDRLTMLMTDTHSIREVILFPLLRPRADSPPS